MLNEYLREVVREIQWYQGMHALILDKFQSRIDRLTAAIIDTAAQLETELGEKHNVQTTEKNH